MALSKTKTGLLFLTVLLLTLFGYNNHRAAAEDPNQIKPSANFVVTDSAHILSEQTKQTILNQEQTFKQTKEQPQVAVLTVNNTDGQSIRDFTNDLTLRKIWHAGKKGQDNGVIIVFAKNNGQNNVRVVTGTGAESVLPDGKIYQLLQAHKDQLKSSDSAAVDLGIRQLFTEVAATLPTTATTKQASSPTSGSSLLVASILVLFLLTIICFVWLSMRKMNGQATAGYRGQGQDAHYRPNRGYSPWNWLLGGWLLSNLFSGPRTYRDDYQNPNQFDNFDGFDGFDGGSDFGGGNDSGGGGDFGGGGSDF